MSPLRVVEDDHGAPLPYDDGNRIFKEQWREAGNAYAETLTALGLAAHPLFVKTGAVTRARVNVALASAERAAKHLNEAIAHLVAAREVFDRAAEYAKQNGEPA